ncbi:type II secretion system protein GspG [Myxococcota bacterium]|nr:type II secretion system protein GspG [Myxococcota bacterium]
MRPIHVTGVVLCILVLPSSCIQSGLAQTRCGSTVARLRLLTESATRQQRITGCLPETLDELTHVAPGKTRPLVHEVPEDGWGRPFHYRVDGHRPIVWSVGPDAEDGTDDDVYPWSRCPSDFSCDSI